MPTPTGSSTQGVAAAAQARRRGGNRLRRRHERAQVDVDGPSQGGDALALVGQIHHGRRAADGQLGVGDEALGHGVGDRRRERVRLRTSRTARAMSVRSSASVRVGEAVVVECSDMAVPFFGSRSVVLRAAPKRRSRRKRPCSGEHAPYDSVS